MDGACSTCLHLLQTHALSDPMQPSLHAFAKGIYSQVNAVMPQAGKEGFGDFVRHVRFVSGVLQSMDIFVTSRETISKSRYQPADRVWYEAMEPKLFSCRWFGGLSIEDKTSSHKQYVTNVMTYAEDRGSSKDYLKYFVRGLL